MNHFDEVFERMKLVTNTKTQVELAEVLGIRQSSISDAKRRNSVPSDWYIKLFEKFGLNPDWLKHAKGPQYLRNAQGDYKPFDSIDYGALYEDKAKYEDPETANTVVTVHSMQCPVADQASWKPVPTGKLGVARKYAKETILVMQMESSAMEPLIQRDAYVGLDMEQKNIVSGEVYGVFLPYEGVALKRVFLDEDNERFILRSENPSHPEQYLELDKYKDRIIGRLSWVLQQL